MNHDMERREIMQSIAEKSLPLILHVQKNPALLEKISDPWIHFLEDHQILMTVFLSNPDKIKSMQKAYVQDVITLLQQQLTAWLDGTPLIIPDKRFNSEEWANNPFFNLLSQQYLLASQHLKSLLDSLVLDDKQQAARVRWFLQQYIEASSPNNFLLTNPQLLAETLQSQGLNLLQGLHRLLTDIDLNTHQLTLQMTDTSAFQIGKNIATTPGHIIFKNDLMELIQYTPQTAKVNATPLLIIPPWINKYYILDLSPHNSLVRWLVEQGITVFMISWVNPGAEHAHKSLADYLHEGPLAAIQVIQTQLHIPQVNAMGFCIGGTLLAMLLAYCKALDQHPVHSATFLASMIDFSDPGDIAAFIDEQQISILEQQMQAKGFLDGRILAQAFNSLRARDLIWAFFVNHYLRAKPFVPFDLLYWNADPTNLPALMHSQYLRWMYLQNHLIVPGKIRINDTPLDVSQIDIPVFFISTQKDHIAPWKTTYLGYQRMRGKKRFILGGSGHIAGIVIPPGSEKYGYYRNLKHPKAAEAWLANATHHTGSWWPEWLRWLKKESGALIDSPDMEALPLKPIGDAPGTYVLTCINHH